MYDEFDFERRFRMTRTVFDSVYRGLQGRGLLVQRQEAEVKPGITPRMHLIDALCLLAHGKGFDKLDEVCNMFYSVRTSILSLPGR